MQVCQSACNTSVLTKLFLLTMTVPIPPIGTLRQQLLNFSCPARRMSQNTRQLPNNCWGDFLGPKHKKYLRVYLQNPNRISARDDFVDFHHLCQALCSNDVDILGLSKTGLDWKQHGPRNKCRPILDVWQHSRLIALTSNVSSESFTQFGGTCTGVTGERSGRISAQGMDSHGLGRWSHALIHGKNGRKVLIATAYQACKASIGTSGSKTACSQQWHLTRQSGDLKPDPRKRFITDLLDAFLSTCHAKGVEILLMGDFNETLGDSLQGLDAILNKHSLLDLPPYHHGMEGEVETHSRGSKQLDCAFGTQELAESITRIGVTPHNFVVASDHRGLFVDLNVDAFLGGDPSHLMSPALRGIKSNSPKQCRKYVEVVATCLTKHRVFERANRLQAITDLHGLTPAFVVRWERIDRDLLRACLHAERLTKSRDRPAWSPKLHLASMIVAC
jgi:hypothetical protein